MNRVRIHTHEILKSRKKSGEFHTLYPLLRKSPVRFQEYYHMEMGTFDYILSKVEKYLEKDWCNFHDPIYPDEQLTVMIRFLVTGLSYKNMEKSFRIGASTICEIVENTMDVVWNKLGLIHMPLATKKSLKQNAKDFYRLWNLPNCVGAIDVRHIRIKRPPKSGNKYRNYKNFHSVALQGVVDANYRYISVDVGGYGRQHDATTLRASKFYKALEAKIIKLPKESRLPKSNIVAPYFFVGDGAYPLMENLIKPFPGQDLPKDKSTLNYRVTRARLVSECAFGQTCQRFPIFYTMIQCSIKKTIMIGQVTCLLHNIIVDLEKCNKEFVHRKNVFKKELEAMPKSRKRKNLDPQNGFPVGNGHQVREKIKQYVLEHPYKKQKRQ